MNEIICILNVTEKDIEDVINTNNEKYVHMMLKEVIQEKKVAQHERINELLKYEEKLNMWLKDHNF